MSTNCQMAAKSTSGEPQNLGAVNSFQDKKKGWSTSIQEPDKGSNLQDVFVLILFCAIHDVHCIMEEVVTPPPPNHTMIVAGTCTLF